MNAIDIVKDYLNHIRDCRSVRSFSSDDFELINIHLHQLLETLDKNNIIDLGYTSSMNRYYDRMYFFVRLYDHLGKLTHAEMYIPC